MNVIWREPWLKLDKLLKLRDWQRAVFNMGLWKEGREGRRDRKKKAKGKAAWLFLESVPGLRID